MLTAIGQYRGKHAQGHYVQHHRRDDTPRLALRARCSWQVSDNHPGARLLRREGDVPRQIRRGVCQGGLASIVYDNRNFGASDGEPRQEIDPWLQVRDYSDAITFAQTLEQTDPARIGVWGSSFSGADRTDRAAGRAPAMLPVVAEDPMASSALPTADSYKWFTETAATRAPSWRNEVTLRTIEYAFGYEPGAYIGLISPTPLMLIVAVQDHLAVSDLAIAAYERAYEPKRLVLLPGGHFDAYVAEFEQSSGPACDWFRIHLQ
jgi:hypothetical protein